jgi:MFS family permease
MTGSPALLMARALRPFTLLLCALAFAEVTGSFEAAMVISAMKHLIEDFGDPARVGWLVTAYLIVAAAAAALVGRMGDIFGRRRILLIVLAVAVVGSIISAVGESFGWVLFGRILQGLTGAILPLSIGLVRENMPQDQMAMGIGLMISGASIGTATGLILGGWISDNYSWQGVFWASAAFCAATLCLVRLWVPVSQAVGDTRGIEWFSGILFAPAIMLLLYYFGSIAKLGFFDPIALKALAAGLILISVWLWRSLTSHNPLLDIRQFRNRFVCIAALNGVFVALSSLQITLVFAILLQAPAWTGVGLGVTALASGLAKLPSNIGATFAGPLSGWITGRSGGRTTLIAAGLLATTGWTLALFVHGSVTQVIFVLCVISFGTTMLFATGPTIVAGAVPPERTSEVTGMLGVVRGLFSGIGGMMVTSLLATETIRDSSSKGEYPTPAAFDLTLTVIIGFSLLATLTAFALPKGHARA